MYAASSTVERNILEYVDRLDIFAKIDPKDTYLS